MIDEIKKTTVYISNQSGNKLTVVAIGYFPTLIVALRREDDKIVLETGQSLEKYYTLEVKKTYEEEQWDKARVEVDWFKNELKNLAENLTNETPANVFNELINLSKRLESECDDKHG